MNSGRVGLGTLMDAPPEEVMIVRLLEYRAAEGPDNLFFTFGEDAQSFGGFNAMANRVARNLIRLGVRRDTRVAVLMDTSVEYMWLWFALAKIGAIEIAINTAYRGDLLTHVLKTSGAELCVADLSYGPALEEIVGEVPTLERLMIHGGSAWVDAGASRLSFAQLLQPTEETNIDADIAYSDLGGIIFTSGTTGPSKGVMLSHHYLAAYGFMYAEVNGLKEDDVVLNYLPFFHIGAKFLTIGTLVCGGVMRLVPRLSVSAFWDEVRACGATNFVAVGGVCNMLLARPPKPDDNQTTIRTIYAVPDPEDIHEELESRFGCTITSVYGSTEVGLPLFRGVNDPYYPGSCGRQSPYYDVEIIDDHDQPVPPGTAGEIAIRPKRAFLAGSGYVGMPERTVAAWRNLWLHSGDRAVATEDGWFYFHDRATDSIRRRGENISSFEVEQLVGKHPAVAEVAAVPAPSELGEDEVWVLVILREGHSVSHEELLLHCGANMPYFMIPRFIDIVESLPRTPTSKVEKYKIRKAGLGPNTWDRAAHGWSLSRGGLLAPCDRQGA